jgi:segregation and condensation protein A
MRGRSATASSRTEVIVTFLAVLELIRLRQFTAVQDEPFGEIEITRAAPQTDPEPAPDNTATPPAGDPAPAS